MGVQGAPLALMEIQQSDEEEDEVLGAENEAGGEEEDAKEGDLRRSLRLERLGTTDDKVEDRAIHNARVRNLEIPKERRFEGGASWRLAAAVASLG